VRDLRFKVAAELIQKSKQPLKPGIFTYNDKLFSEQGKPITSMPSHHNLNTLFCVINDSSTKVFHEINIQHRESVSRSG